MHYAAARGPFTIYGIVDPQSGLIVYVGQTSDFEAKKHSHVSSVASTPDTREPHAALTIAKWFQDAASSGRLPCFVVLEVVEGWDRSSRSEAEWIDRLLLKNHPLLNRWHGSRPDVSIPPAIADRDAPDLTHRDLTEVLIKQNVGEKGRSPEAKTCAGKKSVPANAGKPWNVSLDHRVASLFQSGESIGTIAGRMQRTRGAIRSRLVRLGLVSLSEDGIEKSSETKKPEVIEQGRLASPNPGSRGQVWTRSMDAQLSEAFRRGCGAIKIASETRRTPAGVRARLVRLGLIQQRSELRD